MNAEYLRRIAFTKEKAAEKEGLLGELEAR
jgi:hypothetical protein